MRRRALCGALFLAIAAVACGPSSPHVISESTGGAYEAALAVLPDGLIAAWYDTRDGNADIYVRELDGDGVPSRPERRLTIGAEDSYEASIDVMEGALAVAWYDKDADGVLAAFTSLWDLDGTERWRVPLGPRTRNPVVRASDGRILSAWIAAAEGGGESVWAGWWDAAGRALAPPRRVGPAGKTTWNLNAAIDGNGAGWIVYDAVAGTRAEELFLVRIDRHAAGPASRISGDDGFASKYPDLAIDAERMAVTWYDARDGNTEVYLAVGEVADLVRGVEPSARRVTATAGESIGAYVALNRGRTGVAWSDDTPGQHEVYFQEFGADGHPAGEARRVTTSAADSLIPAIRPWRDGFALAWNEYTPGGEGHAVDGSRSHIELALVP